MEDNQLCSAKTFRRRKRRKQQAINLKLKKVLMANNQFAICCYCKNTFAANQLTIEHKIPICLGGTSDIQNVDLACAPCNQAKGREAWLYKRSLIKESINYASQYGKRKNQTISR